MKLVTKGILTLAKDKTRFTTVFTLEVSLNFVISHLLSDPIKNCAVAHVRVIPTLFKSLRR